MQLTLIINSIVSLLGVLGGFMFAAGSAISIANMPPGWRSMLLPAALVVPLSFLVSGIGAWIANAYTSPRLVIGLIAFPWCYTVIFVLLMLLAFKK